MKFRQERKRYFDGLLIGLAIDLLVTALSLGSVLLALHYSSWIPIIVSLVILVVIGGLQWFDLVYGWPVNK